VTRLKQWPKELVEYHAEIQVNVKYVWLYVYDYAGKKYYHLLDFSNTVDGIDPQHLREILEPDDDSVDGDYNIEQIQVVDCRYAHLDDFLDKDGSDCTGCDECLFRD
jgi:hypothetical protein